ncbi:MAG: cation transporter [Bacteroidales bacterium]|nr:cation transporter [Bacteroidales bacterium]MBK9357301.1 cation transporter [Bacteroidales bacterium]
MKKFNIILIFIFVLSVSGIHAQTPKTIDLEIKTSAQCGMCKETIEKAMAFEKGVIKSELIVETKILKVTFKPSRTSAEAIRKAVSEAGYDADEVKADTEAYKNLPDCCKKPEDRQSDHSGHNH